jgi:hypothetical protein
MPASYFRATGWGRWDSWRPDLTAESQQHSSGNYAILDHIAALR